MTNSDSEYSSATPEIPAWLKSVQGQVEGLRFGVIQITVHDSKVVQIERTERVRFDLNSARSPGGDPSNAYPATGGRKPSAFSDRKSGGETK